jgi:hypothetical protein
MTTTVLSDGFLLEIALIMRIKALRALIEFRRILNLFLQQLRRMLATLTSIEFWRFLSLVLKRVITIIKKALGSDNFPNALLESIYILHFLRAFLTIVNFCKERNKNLVEISKFLLAIIKVILALLMLTFIVLAIAHGCLLPTEMFAYCTMKSLFSTYTFTKFIISFASLGYSSYQHNKTTNELEHAWLREQYYKNVRKHREILLVGVPLTILLSLITFMGGVTGLGLVGFIVLMSLACSLLVVDILKSIYYFYAGTKVAEPQIASLKQENSLIEPTRNDYYSRKCRTARLSENNIHKDKIYLLKEIIIKTIKFDFILKDRAYLKLGIFFSEEQKIREKRNGLIQEAAALLHEHRKENISLFEDLLKSFLDDKDDIKKTNNNKIILPIERIENELHSLGLQLKVMKGGILLVNKAKQENTTDKKNNTGTELLREILCSQEISLKSDITGDSKPKANYSPRFFQSLFRKVGDCEDIHRARCALSEKAVQSEVGYEQNLVLRKIQCLRLEVAAY